MALTGVGTNIGKKTDSIATNKKMQPKLTNHHAPAQAASHCVLGGVGLEGVEVLTGLGLSERQARVYLALLKVGGGRARIVSNLTGISRQDIYRLFGELLQLGLVRQNLTVPVSYSPAPVAEAMRLLLERKTEELTALTTKSSRLTEKLSQTATPIVVAPKQCFGEVFEAERGERYRVTIEQAQGSVEGVFSWVRFRQFSFRFESELRAALGRDVALRFVVEVPAKQCLPRWINPLPRYRFELKTLSDPPDAAIAIFDGVQAAIAFDSKVRVTQGIDLWTTHPAFNAICRAYFYRAWANAAKQS